ncbi:hemerythrin domain-containing protein [Pontiellaceae bacterium B12227]|nr:hemerythrin domain-containing protein [Pontiellaceae bacterium B12227]
MSENITQLMMDEHQLILRMITLVENNTAKIEAGTFNDWNFYLDAIDFVRNYADRFHHAKEEDVLFVELVKNGMPEKSSPIEAMLMEHDLGRAFIKNLEEAVSKTIQGSEDLHQVIVENAKGYATLLRGHIQKEDQILYPLAERVLPEAVRPRMTAAYDKVNAADPELEQRYQAMVERYEQASVACD